MKTNRNFKHGPKPKTPKTLTTEECHAFLEGFLCKEGTFKQFAWGVRNYTMALLMLETGLRVGELVQLRWPDLYFNFHPVRELTVRTEIAKNKHERRIPISTRLKYALETHWNRNWNANNEDPAGFVFARHDTGRQLTTRQVERIVGAIGWEALGRRIHPHALRHTFASKLMRKTNARVVQELLGHSNLNSTQIYTHPNGDDLRKAIDSKDCEKTPQNSQLT